jgi:Mrp family chromosome partitioning ATPase
MGLRAPALRRLLKGRETPQAAQTPVAESSGTASDVSLTSPLADVGEYFRRVYISMKLGSVGLLAVTSATEGEGKSTVAIGLAVALAKDFPERRVALVEMDMRRPTLAGDFGLPPTPGLADSIAMDQPLREAYRPTARPNLALLPAGGPTANQTAVLPPLTLREALVTVRRDHDVVIADLPSVLTDSSTLVLSNLADGVVFVVRAGFTPRSMVGSALAELGEDRLRGIVLNRTGSAVPQRLRRLLGL